MAPHVNDDLELFYELIDEELPDVEVNQVLFAFFGWQWDIQITKCEVLDTSEEIPTNIIGYSVSFTIDDEIVAEYNTKYKYRAITLCEELVEKYISEEEDIDVAERYLASSE